MAVGAAWGFVIVALLGLAPTLRRASDEIPRRRWVTSSGGFHADCLAPCEFEADLLSFQDHPPQGRVFLFAFKGAPLDHRIVSSIPLEDVS